MAFPDFIIIGAQKSGTTTLYRDLESHPGCFFPLDKEPSNLARPDASSPEQREEYEALFRRAKSDQLIGEASTDYTKRPDIEAVPEHALAVCGPELKTIYIVRDPVERLLSHHRHLMAEGRAPASLREALAEHASLLDYSRYDMQWKPWLETFGPQRCLLIYFDDYVADRRNQFARVCRFLGLDPSLADADLSAVFNASERKPVSRGFFDRVRRTAVYQKLIRPWLTPQARRRLINLLLPKSDVSDQRVEEGLLEELRAQLDPHWANLESMAQSSASP